MMAAVERSRASWRAATGTHLQNAFADANVTIIEFRAVCVSGADAVERWSRKLFRAHAENSRRPACVLRRGAGFQLGR
mgnify:CR=1 FL=1